MFGFKVKRAIELDSGRYEVVAASLLRLPPDSLVSFHHHHSLSASPHHRLHRQVQVTPSHSLYNIDSLADQSAMPDTTIYSAKEMARGRTLHREDDTLDPIPWDRWLGSSMDSSEESLDEGSDNDGPASVTSNNRHSWMDTTFLTPYPKRPPDDIESSPVDFDTITMPDEDTYHEHCHHCERAHHRPAPRRGFGRTAATARCPGYPVSPYLLGPDTIRAGGDVLLTLQRPHRPSDYPTPQCWCFHGIWEYREVVGGGIPGCSGESWHVEMAIRVRR